MNKLIVIVATITLLVFTPCHHAYAQETTSPATAVTGGKPLATGNGDEAATAATDETDSILAGPPFCSPG